MAERRYYVYIMASKSRVIYVDVTGFLMARVLRHRAGEGGHLRESTVRAGSFIITAFRTSAMPLRGRRAEEMAAREEGGLDSGGEPDLGGSVERLGRGGDYEGVADSRFLTGRSARFGMTSLPTRTQFRLARKAAARLRDSGRKHAATGGTSALVTAPSAPECEPAEK
jgi:hypothetical protein